MPESVDTNTQTDEDLGFAARMTNIQFAALALHVSCDSIADQLASHIASRRPVRGKLADAAVVRKWLLNGWNTEQLLRANRQSLTEDALRHSLHWAFPQAYYSVFSLVLAYFNSVGFSEESYASVIRKFGAEAASGKYPIPFRALAEGHPPAARGLNGMKLPHSLYFEPNNQESIDAQLAQFLCATRRIDIRQKKGDFTFKTKKGTRRKSFGPEEWKQVSDGLGYTSILSLLYRKRIKANYRDIDTFLHPDLDADRLYLQLLRVVSNLNLVHETMIACAMGLSVLENALAALPGTSATGPKKRIDLVGTIAT